MPLTNFLQYSPELKHAIQIAQSIAKEYKNAQYSPSHLLQAVLHDDIGLSSALASADKDIHYMRDWASAHIKRYPKSAKVTQNPTGDEKITKVMEVADIVRLKLSLDNVSPICVLVALCRSGVAYDPAQLKTFPLTEKELLEIELSAIEENVISSSSNGSSSKRKSTNESKKALAKFCINRTAEAKDGKIDPIVGRDREVQEISKILGRRRKPNVIIVGEPGVGKTALVEGFAQRIVDDKVPTYLAGSDLFELDMGTLIAGASYKGEIEDRLKSIIKELKEYEGKAILFIDEIHILLDPKGGAGGAANLLKPELARGAITVIGATTFEEYRKYIEKDDAFKRRFDVVEVEEPGYDKAMRMLKTLTSRYEEHHEIEVEESALDSAIRLSMRYFREKQMPDACIDLVDRTMASARMMKDTTERELKSLDEELSQLVKDFGKDEKYLGELIWFDSQIRDRISPILLGSLEDLKEASKFEDPADLKKYIDKILKALSAKKTGDKKSIDDSDIMAVVAYATGIPVGKIQADERSKLEQMTDRLKQRVIGQDHAIESLASSITISRAGLADGKRPVGAFFFLGPTGTGKTELAKALADFLFNDEKALIRFDMSEFTEKHTAQFLIGAPPGYVGYEEGGALVNAIRRQPYSIVLFDEIEKAHPEVFKTFLQVLDDGKLSDKLGKEGDFTNAIILFTSNIGSEYIVEEFNKGVVPGQQALTQSMSKHFKDEFLGRLTEIIPFAPINENTVVTIFEIQLKSLRKSLAEKSISLEISEKALKFLAMRGFSPRFGARPLRRVVRSDLQKPLAQMIVSGKLSEGQTVKLDLENDDTLKWDVK